MLPLGTDPQAHDAAEDRLTTQSVKISCCVLYRSATDAAAVGESQHSL
jgi:hypothetical protein